MDFVVLTYCLIILGKSLYDRVQQISQIQRIRRGNGNRLPQSQVIKLIHIVYLFRAVNLINSQHHRFFRRAQDLSNLFIRRRQSGTSVNNKNNNIRFFYGNLRLPPHRGKKPILCFKLNTSRIDHGKSPVKPDGVQINAIPGHARNVIDNGNPFFSDLIEQRGLSYIGASYDGDDGLAHITFPPILYKRRCSARYKSALSERDAVFLPNGKGDREVRRH